MKGVSTSSVPYGDARRQKHASKKRDNHADKRTQTWMTARMTAPFQNHGNRMVMGRKIHASVRW
jgi:hypothetical protein